MTTWRPRCRRASGTGALTMPRALWSGSLSFGLVNVPVQLVSAARDLDYHFHELHEKDKVRIEQRRFCSKEDVEVIWEEIAHAYDLDGKQVIVTDEELASVEPRKTRTIDIEAFVELADVDPIYFDHPYFLVPAGDSEGTLRAYRLLVEVMGGTERVGARALRDAHEGVPGGRARPRGRAAPDDDALPRRGPADEADPDGRQEAREEAARPGGRADRGALDRLGPDELRGLLPRAPEARDREQAQAAQDRGPEARARAAAGAGPDGGAPARGRERARRPRRPDSAGERERGDGDLGELSRDELVKRAKEKDIPGRTKMSKKELVEALSE